MINSVGTNQSITKKSNKNYKAIAAGSFVGLAAPTYMIVDD